jgi:hypothetical protein
MVQEIQTYGRLLNISALRVRGNIERAAIHVTADNFDHNDSQRRPPAWTAIRLRRVVAQEDLTVDDGSYQTRPQRVEKVISVSFLNFIFSIFLFVIYVGRAHDDR